VSSRPASAAPARLPAGPRVLVVEDNPVEQVLLCRILSNAGLVAEAVASGEAGVAAARARAPDLVLLDALLPDIDGFEVCRRLRHHATTRHTPVVMLTGLEDGESIRRAYDAGATDFITKPINHLLLVHRLRYLLRARRALDELRHSRESLASAQRVAGLGHWEVDLALRQVSLSDELRQLLQLPPARPGEDGLELLLASCHPDDRAQMAEVIQGAMDRGHHVHFDHRVLLPGGEERTMEVHLTPLKEGGTPRLLGISMDISARKESEREILRLAYFDRLTGLPNRSWLELHIDQAIPRAHVQGAAVLLLAIDLDLFSRINNAMGHSAGDAVLRQAGQRLVRLLDVPDPEQLLAELSLQFGVTGHAAELVARLGADNFVVAISGWRRNSPRVAALVEQVRRAYRQPFLYRGQELFVTASLGIAWSDSGSCAAEALLQRADLALHEAKAQGRDAVCEYHGGLVARVSAELALQGDLRKALERDEFRLHYQPQISLVDGRVQGCEALIRWHHPERGLVPPEEFISVAEETGQIVAIGRWALQSACLQQRRWLDAGLAAGPMAVNISARQFREPRLEGMIQRVLAQTGLPASELELEITEGVLMTDARAGELLARLRDQGVSIALDDFGTGYSSLSYLIRFPIDVLKIDRCFVQGIAPRSQQSAIVAAVTSLSRQLGLKVVAEGVESQQELALLRELGCDEVQGFLLCPPLSADAMEGWLREADRPRPEVVHAADAPLK